MEETIFDKILKKTIPATIVFEDEQVLAFKDISPQAPTHIIVIPKKKFQNFSQMKNLPAEEVGEFLKGVSAVAQSLNLTNGYRIVFNCGKHGQQTVDYIHAHILGGKQLKWPPC